VKKIVFVANNNIGSGLSGGDRIFIELMRGWGRRAQITLIGSEEAIAIARARGVTASTTIESDHRNTSANCESIPGLIRHFPRRTVKGGRAVRLNWPSLSDADAVYSASDFYPDVLPAFNIKRRKPGVTWIAGYYLFVPSPYDKESPYRGKNTARGFLYWLMQIPSYWLVNKFADYVFVTSQPDVRRFVTGRRSEGSVVVVQGGVDTYESEKYLASADVIPVGSRKYDACFVGRFHYQKGVVELVDIWRLVLKEVKDARLAMIGNGPLEGEVRAKIRSYGLENNIELLGFRDGLPKYDVFRQSKMILHPATYDSGGMAAAEGMAWRLPAVSFDLEALKTYYPQGMLKSEKENLGDFAGNVIRLLKDKALYEVTAEAALGLVRREWLWEKRSERIFESVFGES